MAKSKSFSDSLKRAAAKKPEEIMPAEAPAEDVTPVAGVPESEEPKKKRSVGRPKKKTEPTRNINVAVSVSLISDIEIAKNAAYNGNLTEYINSLIRYDLEKNLETYKDILNGKNQIKH